ncbi:MAG TPA: helix-turn-helix transcriptional regulator [Porticoccaceae bacterium]|nr:helix-turn-helix transcriptional regulator [Porticoccaceae bacterium]
MARKISALPPQTLGLLHRFGERLHLLRVRRRLSAKQVAAATGMSVMTLRSLERGGDGVTIGAYLAVMEALGIERDLEELAAAAFLTEADDLARTASVSRRAGGMASIEAPAVTVAAVADAPLQSPGSSERAPDGVVDAPVESAPVERAAAGDARAEEVMVDGAVRPVGLGGFEWLDAPGRDLRRLLGVAAPAESGRRSPSQKVVKPKAEAEADAGGGAAEVTPDLFDAPNAKPAGPS